MYESEHTRFIRELMQQHPDLPKKQQEGRAIWWDKSLDRDLYTGFTASQIPQSPYVYSNLAEDEEHQGNQ